MKDGSGTITAANASSLNDGAAAAVVVRGDQIPEGLTKMCHFLEEQFRTQDAVTFINTGKSLNILTNLGATPLAEVVAFTEAGGDPIDFTVAPVWAVRKVECCL